MIADVKIISIDTNGGYYISVNNSRYWTILTSASIPFPTHLGLNVCITLCVLAMSFERSFNLFNNLSNHKSMT
jgi:hypothetical protein